MRSPRPRFGLTNGLYLVLLAALAALVVLGFLLSWKPSGPSGRPQADEGAELVVFCAAGIRYPMQQIAEEYQQRYDVAVRLQFGGSNTLLSQIEVARSGDLYLAADDSYIRLAREKGLAAESIPLALQKPVIAVPKGNPRGIDGIQDLLRPDVSVALGQPDAAAVGKVVRKLLTATGQWSPLEQQVTHKGVFKETVNAVANDLKIGSVDAGIIWDSTVAQYPELEMVSTPELDAGQAPIELAVLNSASDPTAALHFARFVGARDVGLPVFQSMGFEVVDGDVWQEEPELTFFAGSVNRRALEPVIQAFERREGVRVNTVYNGCGILTAQMETMQQNQESGFPDAYMACDVYYLETVKDWFQDDVRVSNTDIVIAVQKGNPKNIQSLQDLAQPGVRLAIGQPDQCTIGVLTRRLLQQAGLYEKLLAENVRTQTATSALLVPNVTTGAADAVLAYETDTLAERDKLDIIRIDSELARAVQPYSIARSSDFKHLGRRLYAQIARSRREFESAGFHWLLDTSAGLDSASITAP